jgi:hypothetical protein
MRKSELSVIISAVYTDVVNSDWMKDCSVEQSMAAAAGALSEIWSKASSEANMGEWDEVIELLKAARSVAKRLGDDSRERACLNMVLHVVKNQVWL